MSIKLTPEAYTEFEGEWNGFRFRRVEAKDYKAVLDHVAEHFVRDEPTCKILGYSEEFARDFNRFVEPMLPHQMSFIAEDVETGEIAGVRVSFHARKDDSFEGIPLETHHAKLLGKLIHELENLAKIPETLGIDEWAELFLTSTVPKYRQRGLAGELYERSMKFFKQAGFKYTMVIVSNPYTRMATEKKGFRELSCVKYKDFLDFDGKPAFPHEKLTSEHFACVRVKEL